MYFWSILLLAGNIFFPCYATSWSIWNGLFFDSDLTLIFTPEFGVHCDFPHYRTVTDANSNTPLRIIVLCRTAPKLRYPTGNKSMEMYGRAVKSARRKVTILPMYLSVGKDSASVSKKCEILIKTAKNIFRQEYIFAQTSPNPDAACLRRHVHILGTINLVLFESYDSTTFFIPCLTCRPLVFTYLRTVSWLTIREAWDASNSNMHQYFVYVLSSADGKCGLDHTGFVNLQGSNICEVSAVAEKYNLTLMEYNGQLQAYSDESFGIFGYSDGTRHQSDYYIHQVIFASINFITISNPPSLARAIVSLLSPLDVGSWTCLIFIVSFGAGVLTLVDTEGLNRASYLDGAERALNKMVVVTCLLLGQVGESKGKPYRTGTAVLVLLTLWLFGYFILMQNLYQGSMYSNLAVLKPTRPPGGVYDLVNWDIPIVSMDIVYDYKSRSAKSILADYVMPQLLAISESESELSKLIMKLKEKIGYGNGKKTLLKTLSLGNLTMTHCMVVVFVFTHHVVTIESKLKLMGNRQVVRNKDSSPFAMTQYMVGRKNLLTRYFSKELGYMLHAGLTRLWSKVGLQSLALRGKSELKEGNKYFEAVQQAFGNLRDPVTFHESQPVSVKLLMPGFILCSIVMSIALLVFLVEYREKLLQTFLTLLVMLGSGIVYRICKIQTKPANLSRKK